MVEQQPEGEEQPARAFLEEDLLQSRQHKFQQATDDPIGSFERSLTVEASRSSWAVMGQGLECAANEHIHSGEAERAQTCFVQNAERKEMGQDVSTCSGPSCPPGFEIDLDWNGLSKQNHLHVNNMDESYGTEQSGERSECSNSFSSEKVPQTPLYDSYHEFQENFAK